MWHEKFPIVPNVCDAKIEFNVSHIKNPFTGGIKTVEMPGAKWKITLGYKLNRHSNMRKLDAAIASLKGGAVITQVRDYNYTGRDELISLSVTLAEDGETGTGVTTEGWPVSGESLIAGDRISWVDPVSNLAELHIVVEAGPVDGAGKSVLVVEPEIKRPTSKGVEIELIHPVCSAYLMEDGGGVKRREWNKVALAELVFQEAIYGV